ncbi:nucleoside phosphorylase-I family protein [Asaia prunellae]|uniref:hypothetical protein n=1 Tax=Asaia prunellae TaxID=610245 RepID=UPI000471121C|nr:hypothetical protein [Asaia prunellae]
MLGILVGLKAEARLIRPCCPGLPVAISGATSSGAQAGVDRLLAAGATSLLSFGCAAGLAPDLAPGSIIIPQWVMVHGARIKSDSALSRKFGVGQPGVLHGGMLHSDGLVTTAVEKNSLHTQTGCLALDMESGFVARAGLPFAVLRVVCDDSKRDLPPAACDVLAEGHISPFRLLRSLVQQPGQIGDLMALGRDARTARDKMAEFLRQLY